MVPLLVTPGTVLAQPGAARLTVEDRAALTLPLPGEAPLGRVVGVVLFSDGAVAIADESEPQVRFFGRNGVEYGSVGRSGGGPGEFALLTSIERCGKDTVFAFDAEQGRVTVLSAKGQVARTFKVLAGGNKAPYKITCNGGRSILVLAWPRFPKDLPLGPYRESSPMYLADLTGRNLGPLGEFMADERYRFARSDGPRIFGKQLVVAGTGDRIFVGEGERYSIMVINPKGDVLDTLRKRASEVSVVPGDIEQYLADYLELVRDPGARENQRRAFRDYKFPAKFPPYSRLLLDPQGNLWVCDYRPPTQSRETWTVFSPSGNLIGEVRMPQWLEVLDIGAGFLAGRSTEGDGSQRVVIHRLAGVSQ